MTLNIIALLTAISMEYSGTYWRQYQHLMPECRAGQDLREEVVIGGIIEP